MLDYYVTTDLIASRIFVTKTLDRSDQRPFLVEFDNISAANQYLKKLTAKLIKDPRDQQDIYHLIETVEVELGKIKEKVDIFKLN